jgi:hypothetical protein
MGGGRVMGDRSLIQVESVRFKTPITFYGHWSGETNLLAVRNVLARTDRIGDVSYLTAQLFYEFAVALGGYDGNLSFGIDTWGADENSIWVDNDTVVVNADTGAYTYQGETITEFALADKTV